MKEMTEELKELEKKIQLVDDNTKRRFEIFDEKLERVTKTVESLSPEKIALAVQKLQEVKDIERINEKDNTTNTLAIGLLILLGVYIVFAFSSVLVLITQGYNESLEALGSKVLSPILLPLVSIVSMMAGYYFTVSGMAMKKDN